MSEKTKMRLRIEFITSTPTVTPSVGTAAEGSFGRPLRYEPKNNL